MIKLLFVVAFFSSCSGDKLAYVDIAKLFESFNYKKVLTKEYDQIKMSRQRIIDSLEYDLNRMATEIEKKSKIDKNTEVEFEEKRKRVYTIEKQYEEDNQILITSYNEKIITQLNSYIKEYGKKNGYKFILGTDNKGTLLYGDEGLDITDKVTIYVNDRFQGERVK
ncbi:MAG: OmpH family outer membrane protein [bacterium]|nr:OmpH family outer membrane protein [bacterium]